MRKNKKRAHHINFTSPSYSPTGVHIYSLEEVEKKEEEHDLVSSTSTSGELLLFRKVKEKEIIILQERQLLKFSIQITGGNQT